MLSDSTFCYEDPDEIVIKNGIMTGPARTYVKDNYDSFGEMVLGRLVADPKFVGQVDGLTGRKETFEEMREKSVKCAMWMKQQNVGIGDIVGICTHNQMDMYVPCLASLYIGAVYNAWWDVGLTKEVAKHFIELTRPKVLFLTEATAKIILEAIEELGAKISVVIFGESTDLVSLSSILESQDSKNVNAFRCTKLSSLKEPAVILYTSGSTGLPKGVVYSNKSLLKNIHHYANFHAFENSVTLLFSPLSWLTGVYTMLRGIVVPDRRIIHPEYTPINCLKLIEKYKINWVLLGPSATFALAKCSEISKYDVSSLKVLFVGGSAIRIETQMSLAKHFPQAFICQGYGSTELAGIGVSQKEGFRPGSCGRVSENKELKIVDPESGRILNPNETGEVCFKCADMMDGYYRNPQATRETIDSEGWLHTGDLAYYDERGYFFFVDRLKELIKFRGYHVSPTMIENVILEHPAVLEAAVVSVPHELDEEHPIAFVETKPGLQVTQAQLEKMVADVLPDYMKLRAGVKFLQKMPHTSSEKIARKELKILAKTYVQ